MKRIWSYVIVEPFKWLFYCFFQPTRFRRDFEIKGFWKRILPMLRLALPMFLVSYLLVLLVSLIPCRSFFNLDIGCYPDPFQALLRGVSWASVIVMLKYTLLNIFLMSMLGLAVGILWGIVGSIVWGIMWGITFSFALSSVGGSIFFLQGGSTSNLYLAFNRGMMVAIIFGIVGGIIEGIEWGLIGGIVGGLIGSIAWGIAYGVAINQFSYPPSFVRSSIPLVIVVAIAFIVSYLFGYYRLPFYIVSGLLGLRAYFACRKKPVEIFSYLHRSPLYWDENVFLPLPGLKSILLLAADQDIEQ